MTYASPYPPRSRGLTAAQAVLLIPCTLYIAATVPGVLSSLLSVWSVPWPCQTDTLFAAVVVVSSAALWQLWSLLVTGVPASRRGRIIATAVVLPALVPTTSALASLVAHALGHSLEALFSRALLESFWAWLAIVGGPSLVAVIQLGRLWLKKPK